MAFGATFKPTMTISKAAPPAGATVGKRVKICGAFGGGAWGVTVKTTVLELSEEFETDTFTAPAVATSCAGMDTTMVSQALLEVQACVMEGLSALPPKCTVEEVESACPLTSRLNCALPAGKLAGEIEMTDGVAIGGAMEPPPQPATASNVPKRANR
jgi:hypothetical protein